MTVALPVPWLPGADVPNSLADALQQNFDALRSAVPTLSPTARGSAVAAITNGVDVAITIPHGLANTPTWAQATATTVPGVRDDFFASIASLDATNVTVNVRASEAAVTPVTNPTNIEVFWEAVV